MNAPYVSTIRSVGSIGATRPGAAAALPVEKEKYSVEDFVAKVTSLFLPYMTKEISERNFTVLQEEVGKAARFFKRGGA